jgi:hypothetical protein
MGMLGFDEWPVLYPVHAEHGRSLANHAVTTQVQTNALAL